MPSSSAFCWCLSHTFVLLQADGGYIGTDFQAFYSAVASGAAGVFLLMLVADADINTLLTVTPGQSITATGDPSFAPVPNGQTTRSAPLWGTGSFAVLERGSLTLTNIALHPSATIDLSGGGSLSLASMLVPLAVLTAAERTLSGVGSTLRLDAVTVPDGPRYGVLTGTAVVAPDGSKAFDPASGLTFEDFAPNPPPPPQGGGSGSTCFEVRCGNAGHCAEDEYCASPNDRHEVTCCSDIDLGGWASCTVDGATRYAEREAGGLECTSDATYADAEATCAAVGARLCTLEELEANCGIEGRRVSCGFDSKHQPVGQFDQILLRSLLSWSRCRRRAGLVIDGRTRLHDPRRGQLRPRGCFGRRVVPMQ